MSSLCDKIDSNDLFSAIIRGISEEHLPGIILEGLSGFEFEDLILPTCIDHCKQHDVLVRYETLSNNIDSTSYWEELRKHSNQHGPGAILLLISGTYLHWTCVRKVTDRSIMLIDSCFYAKKLSLLRRNTISIDDGQTKCRHLLKPQQTYLLSVRSF